MKILPAVSFAIIMISSSAANAGQPNFNISIAGEFSPGIYGQLRLNNLLPLPIPYTQPRITVHHAKHIVQPVYRTHFDNKGKHSKYGHPMNRQAKHGYMDRIHHEERRDEWRGDNRRSSRGNRS